MRIPTRPATYGHASVILSESDLSAIQRFMESLDFSPVVATVTLIDKATGGVLATTVPGRSPTCTPRVVSISDIPSLQANMNPIIAMFGNDFYKVSAFDTTP